MKRLLLLVPLAVFAVTPILASAAPQVPAVTKGNAIYLTGRYLKEEGSSWNRRDKGSIDCAGGRVNRSAWECRSEWQAGHTCWNMRTKVMGISFKEGVPYYRVHGAEVAHSC